MVSIYQLKRKSQNSRSKAEGPGNSLSSFLDFSGQKSQFFATV